MTVGKDRKVDWFRVIMDLCRQGYTHYTLAAAIGAPKSTVQGWKQGAALKWEDGERLIDFWCQITGKARGDLPMVGRFDWRA